MIAKPLVSVLMTVYNREKYIAEAIESVLASTYQNWELIIVDDRSKDKSVEIAQKYAEKDKRIKVFNNEHNLGDYPNRNQAAFYAKGKYLKYVDADDMIYPYGLEQLVFYMEQFPEAGYGLCSLEQDVKQIFPFQLTPHETYHRHYFESSIFHKAPLSAIIKKEVFDAVGGFTGKRMLGDFEMWHILSQQYNIVLMPHGIVWYRVHDEQEMTLHRKDPFEPFKYLKLAYDIIKNKVPLCDEEVLFIQKRLEKQMARSILSAWKNHSLKKALELKEHGQINWVKIISASLRK